MYFRMSPSLYANRKHLSITRRVVGYLLTGYKLQFEPSHEPTEERLDGQAAFADCKRPIRQSRAAPACIFVFFDRVRRFLVDPADPKSFLRNQGGCAARIKVI